MYSTILWCSQAKLTALYNILQHFLSFTNIIHIIMTNNNVEYTSICAIWETAIYKENESLYYYLPIIPSLPVPTPAPNWHTHARTHARTHTHTHTHTQEYETGSGWHVQINQKAWWKKCVFRLTLKVGGGGRSSQVGWQRVCWQLYCWCPSLLVCLAH